MKKINETFPCISCGKTIPTAHRTCRNHCPHCFTSLHVDGNIPGDRATECHGRMYPVAYEYKTEGVKLLFRCTKCEKEHWNKQAEDDEVGEIESWIEKYRKEFI